TIRSQRVNMAHLDIERLAELVDGVGSSMEREHLASCAMCVAELSAYRRVVGLAADERRRIAPPLTTWDSLAIRLREDGLVATKPVAKRGMLANLSLAARRAAAVLILAGSGAFMGRMSTGLTVEQALVSGWGVGAVRSDAAGGVVLSSLSQGFASNRDALTTLERAQAQYERAAAYLATHDTSTVEGAADQYRTRLAALDRNAETLIQALNESPEDPVINQIYLATLGAREATITKLGTALPVGARLSRF
ncbi:MAG: hypothetical protein ABI877_20920, partial [Gemmatimonadaceae bacterium]